jgi:nuclear transport factor 2 (NTF2) superfamily protein
MPIAQRIPMPKRPHYTAIEKARLAERGWNSRDPEHVSRAYTQDTYWHSRPKFLHGGQQVVDILRRK